MTSWIMMREAAYFRHHILVDYLVPPGPIHDLCEVFHDQFVDFMYSGVLKCGIVKSDGDNR